MGTAGLITQRNGQEFSSDDGPLPLYREIAKGENFPVDALGSTLGGMALALHEAAVQAPLAMTATAALAVATLAVQGLRDVALPLGGKPKKPISLAFLVIAPSGERKSATESAVLVPVKRRVAELKEAYEAELTDYRNAKDLWATQRERILKSKDSPQHRKCALDALGAEPEAPRTPILTCSEPTIEGLTKHLTKGYPSVGLFSSEGGQFMSGYAMSPDAKRSSAGALNRIWDGEPLERIRASEAPVILFGRRLTVFLQAQPEVASEFLTDPVLVDNGLLTRFLVTRPDTMMGRRRMCDPTPLQECAIATFNETTLNRLRRPLPCAKTGGGLEPAPIEMSEAALRLWRAFADDIELSLLPSGAFHEVGGFANKLAEHAARLAAVLAVFDDPNANEINGGHMARALAIARFFGAEALRLHDAAHVSQELMQAQRLLQWLLRSWSEPLVTIRVVQRSGPNFIRDRARALRLMAVLERHGWVKRIANGVVAGKPAREAWLIHRRP